MELLMLGGLALLFVLAAAVDRGERGVETVVIALPTPRPTINPLVPLMVVLLLVLIAMVGLNLIGALLGM